MEWKQGTEYTETDEHKWEQGVLDGVGNDVGFGYLKYVHGCGTIEEIDADKDLDDVIEQITLILDDLDLDLDSNVNMSNTFKNEPIEEPELDREEPEIAPQEDLNNIEGEDLL